MPFAENLGNAGPVLNARYGSSSAVNSNSPTLLDPRASGPFVYVPGTAGNYVAVPHTSQLSVTGDLDLRARVYLDDWTPAATGTVVGKWGAAGQRSYRLSVQTDGTLLLEWSADGTAVLSASSTVAPTVTDGSWLWVRASLDVNNGASGRDIVFYTSTDGTVWTPLGTTVTQTGTTSIFVSSSPVEIGSSETGTAALLTGGVQVVQIAASTTGADVRLLLDLSAELQTGGESLLPDSGSSIIPSADQSLPNLGWGGTVLNARYGSGAGVDGFDPLLLDHTGQNYLYLPGVNGNYISTPDTNALDVTGDIDIKVRVALDDWTPSAINTLVSKYGAAGQISYALQVSTDGTLRLSTSADGTNLLESVSTLATGFADGAAKWVRATMDVDNGSSQRVAKFYTSDDGSSWTQLGSTVTTAGATSIFNSTTQLWVGARGDALRWTTGSIYRVIIQSAYDTANNTDSLVFDTDFTSGITSGAALSVPMTGPVADDLNNASYLTNLGTLDAEAPIRPGSGISVDTNDPRWLAHTGTNYIHTTGVTGNNITIGDKPELQISGDLDIRVHVAAVDWTPAAQGALVSKWNATVAGYELSLLTTGELQLAAHRVAGGIGRNSTDVVPVVDGQAIWLRATRVASTGDVEFFYAASSPSVPSVWTKLGATVTGFAGVLAVDSSPLRVGERATPGAGLAADFYRVQVWNGIEGSGGVLVADVDCTQIGSGADLSVPMSVATSQVVTASPYVENLGTLGEVAAIRPGSAVGADSNDPTFLAHTGTNYLWLSGVLGNWASTPDAAALDITGDIDIRVRVAMDDWTPSAFTVIAAKWGSTNATYSWYLAFNADNTLRLQWVDSALNGRSASSTVATGVADGSSKWVRATLDVDNGAPTPQFEVKFWLSDDNVTYTQLGSTVTGSTGVTNIQATTTALSIGAVAAGTSPSAGKFYRAQIRNGIDGTVVFDADFTTGITSGAQTSFTASTGQTVTINRSTSGKKAVAVTRPCWVFGTDDYMEIPDLPEFAFTASDEFTILMAGRFWSTFPVSAHIAKRAGGGIPDSGWVLRSGLSNGALTAMEIGDGTSFISGTAGVNKVSGDLTMFTGVVTTSSVTTYSGTTAGTAASRGTIGTIANSLPIRIGRYSTTNTNYSEMEFFGAAIFRRALTAGEIATLNDYYVNGGSVAAAEALLATAVLWVDPAKSKAQAAIVRSTTGRKSVAVTRPVWSFGTDDFMEIPNVPGDNFEATDSFTVVAAVRRWTTLTAQQTIMSSIRTVAGVDNEPGWLVRSGFSNGAQASFHIQDNVVANRALVNSSNTMIAGRFSLISAVRDVASDQVSITVDGVTTSITDSTTGSLANLNAIRIGRLASSGTSYADMELFGAAIFRRALTPAEITLLNGYYESGTNVVQAEALLATAVVWVDPVKSKAQAAINRSTTGRKSVAVVRDTLLFGSDDYLQVPDNDLLDFGATDSFTVLIIARQWPTTTANRALIAKRTGTTLEVGYVIRQSTASDTSISGEFCDGSTEINTSATRNGAMSLVYALVRDVGSDNSTLYAGGTGGTAVPDTTTGSLANSDPLQIGNYSGFGTSVDMEFFGAAIWRRALTPTEIATMNTHWQTGPTEASVALLEEAVWHIDPSVRQVAQINRSTSGRKTVACVDCCWLFGSDDYFEIVDDPAWNLTGTEEGTWLVLARRFRDQTFGAALFAKAQAATATSAGWSITNTTSPNVAGQVGDGINGTTATVTSTLRDQEAYVMVRSGGTLTMWRNTTEGAPVADSTTDLSNTFPVRIGRLASTGSGYFDGEMRAVAFWRRALSDSEILTVLNYYGV